MQKLALKKKTNNKQRSWKVSLLIIIILVVASVFLFPRSKSIIFSYKIDEITTEPVIAPFNFPILKSSEELRQDRERARRSVPYLFVFNEAIEDSQLVYMKSFFDDIVTIKSLYDKKETSQTLLRRYRYSKKYQEVKAMAETDSLNLENALARFQDRYRFNLDSESWSILSGTRDESDLVRNASTMLRNETIRIVKDIYARGIVDLRKSEIESDKISINRGGEETIDDPKYYYDLNEAWTDAKKRLQTTFPEQGAILVNTGYDVVVHFLKPNLIYQKDVTESRQQEAVNRVPVSKGMILENEKIVDANVRITPDIYLKLQSLEAERSRRAKVASGIRRELPIVGDIVLFIGRLMFVVAIYSIFFIYLFNFYRQTFNDARMMILICSIFLLILGTSYLFHYELEMSEYTIPITLAALLFTILFNAPLAFIAIFSLSILVGFQLGYKLHFVIISLFASSFGIYTVQVLRKRSQVFKSIIYIVLSYAFSILAYDLLRFADTGAILHHILYSTLNGVLSPFLAYGVIGVLEIAFGITTDLTLLELTDFNHPLLKRLSREAVGTFNHCVAVGNLSEAAADAIGANSLLARVGSYYHDIGKLSKPEYFVENQFRTVNVHDKLAPHLSTMVIINHVKEGIRLAKEYRLPQIVQDFIPTHHGTSLIEYFYTEALEQADDRESVMDSDYRYPGPKPFTKEQGIVMLCESIEAAARSLKNPTISKIEEIVDKIILKRLKEGQLDECPLTMRDLKMLKGDIQKNTGILPVLKGFYHLRIEYPDDKKRTKNPAHPPEIPEKIPPQKTSS